MHIFRDGLSLSQNGSHFSGIILYVIILIIVKQSEVTTSVLISHAMMIKLKYLNLYILTYM